MFKKKQAAQPKAPAREGEREVVVMPGVDFEAVSEAWSYLKKTGRTHRSPRD